MYVIASPFVPVIEGRLNQTKVQVLSAKIGKKKSLRKRLNGKSMTA